MIGADSLAYLSNEGLDAVARQFGTLRLLPRLLHRRLSDRVSGTPAELPLSAPGQKRVDGLPV
jgi:hypothetical protein